MTDNEKALEINKIILWLREVEQLKRLNEIFSYSQVGGKIVSVERISTKCLFWVYKRDISREYQMETEEICLFLDFIRERKNHIQKLIDEYDQEKVELARMVMSGEINPKGLAF